MDYGVSASSAEYIHNYPPITDTKMDLYTTKKKCIYT